MKKSILPVILMLIPLILSAGIIPSIKRLNLGASALNTRGWRLAYQLHSDWEDGEWVPTYKVYPTYDPLYPDRIVQIYSDMWEEISETWTPDMTYSVLEYNTAGRIISHILYINFMNLEMPIIKLLAEYDTQNRISRFSRYHNTDFDPEGPMETDLEDTWHVDYGTDGSFEIWQWSKPYDFNDYPYSHTVFTQDSQTRIIQELNYHCMDMISWEEDYKTDIQYHAQDTSTAASYIDYISANLMLMMLYERELDSFGLLTSSEGYYWNGDGWTADQRNEYQYNAQLLRISKTELTNNHSGSWTPQMRWLYTYDANDLTETILYQYYNGTEYLNDSRQVNIWEHYSDIADETITPIARLAIKAYPIPFSDKVTINIDSEKSSPVEVKVFNLRGQEVRKLSGSETSWDGRDTQGRALSPGIYFIRATQAGRSSTKKIIRL